MKKPLWDRGWTLPEVLLAILEWGHGSGEELHELLVTSGLSEAEAHDLSTKLERAVG